MSDPVDLAQLARDLRDQRIGRGLILGGELVQREDRAAGEREFLVTVEAGALLALVERLQRAEAEVLAVTDWIADMGCLCGWETDMDEHDPDCPGFVEERLNAARSWPQP